METRSLPENAENRVAAGKLAASYFRWSAQLQIRRGPVAVLCKLNLEFNRLAFTEFSKPSSKDR